MYVLKEVTLKNGPHKRKVLVIEFNNPEMAIVGEFLMADASLLDGQIVAEIDHVLHGEKEIVHVSGNRCAVEIKKDNTIITDLFDDIEDAFVYDSYTIDTTELRQIISIWLDKLATFQKENK